MVVNWPEIRNARVADLILHAQDQSGVFWRHGGDAGRKSNGQALRQRLAQLQAGTAPMSEFAENTAAGIFRLI